MKRFYCYIIIALLWLTGCKKSAGPDDFRPPENDNEIAATVSIDGAAPFTFSSKSLSTLFHKRSDPNGEKVTTIVGSYANGQIKLTLVNITSKGSYAFDPTPTTGGSYAFCDYTIGNPFAPTALYSTSFPGGSGSYRIDSMTDTYISGSFAAQCASGANRTNLTNGSFKGRF